MAKKTVLDEAKARIKALELEKKKDLETVRERITETEKRMELAEQAVKLATAEMNLEAYDEAMSEKRKAQGALDMFNGKREQIQQQTYISENESDAIIDALLNYEATLEERLDAEIKEPINRLRTLLADYINEVEEVEATISYWTKNIHATFINRTGKTRIDPETGEHTNRMDKPQKIRHLPYTGGKTVATLRSFLDRVPQEGSEE